MSVRNITMIGLFAAVLCVLSPWAVNIGPIPLTFATFGVYLIGAVLGGGYGTLAVFVYLLVGAAGVPVFSGFSGGLHKIVGVTGGYLLGYIPCVFVTGKLISVLKNKVWWYSAAMVMGTAVLYLFGTVWYIWQTGNSVLSALLLCVVPFLPGDIVKIMAASALGYELKKRLPALSDKRSTKN